MEASVETENTRKLVEEKHDLKSTLEGAEKQKATVGQAYARRIVK